MPIATLPDWPAIPGLRYGFSTRHGGVSAGPYATLNLGYHVGDDPANVSENRRRLGGAMGYDPARLVSAQQVHGAHCAWVGAGDAGRGAFSWDDAIANTDGLLVGAPHLPVAILVADCAPVLVVDLVRRRLAAVHAGWRGALGRITSAAVRLLHEAGTDPADLWVGIGPALCPACLEVGDEVAAEVAAAFPRAAVVPQAGARPHLDLPAMIAQDAAAAGVNPARVRRHPACPRCGPADFFSHRGQGGLAGRFALVAWWE